MILNDGGPGDFTEELTSRPHYAIHFKQLQDTIRGIDALICLEDRVYHVREASKTGKLNDPDVIRYNDLLDRLRELLAV
jgi:hypothetical protein